MNRLQRVQVIVSIVTLATAALFIAASHLIVGLLESKKVFQEDWAFASIGLMIYLVLQAILFSSLNGSEK